MESPNKSPWSVSDEEAGRLDQLRQQETFQTQMLEEINKTVNELVVKSELQGVLCDISNERVLGIYTQDVNEHTVILKSLQENTEHINRQLEQYGGGATCSVIVGDNYISVEIK